MYTIVFSHLEEKIDCSPKGKNLMHWLKVTVCKIGSHLQSHKIQILSAANSSSVHCGK